MEIVEATRIKVHELYTKYFDELGYGIDGYYESRILDSDSYLIMNQKIMGIMSIDKAQRLTGFYVLDEFRSDYQQILTFVLRHPNVQKLMMTSRDTLYMNEIIRRGFKIEIQSYNFGINKTVTTDFNMVLATQNDSKLIIEHFGDFVTESFGRSDLMLERDISNKQIYLKFGSNNELICMGVLDPQKLRPNKVCIGMVVNERERRKGYAVKTITFLIQLLHQQGKEVNARCWVYNEVSKKTLLKSGLFVSNLLLKVESLQETIQVQNG